MLQIDPKDYPKYGISAYICPSCGLLDWCEECKIERVIAYEGEAEAKEIIERDEEFWAKMDAGDELYNERKLGSL
jgi:hypothetical protein